MLNMSSKFVYWAMRHIPVGCRNEPTNLNNNTQNGTSLYKTILVEDSLIITALFFRESYSNKSYEGALPMVMQLPGFKASRSWAWTLTTWIQFGCSKKIWNTSYPCLRKLGSSVIQLIVISVYTARTYESHQAVFQTAWRKISGCLINANFTRPSFFAFSWKKQRISVRPFRFVIIIMCMSLSPFSPFQ